MSAVLDQIVFDETQFDGSAVLGANSTDAIVFNSYGLQNSEIITSEFENDSAPRRNIRRKRNPREDGQTIETDLYSERVIRIEGVMLKSTSAALEAEIDTMKRYLSQQNGRLEITQNGVKRVYTASVVNFDRIFARRTGRDITRAPFEINFLCVEPFGKSEERQVLSAFAVSASPYNFEVYNGGSYKSKPVFFVAFDAADTVSKVNLKNNTTGKEIEITQNFAASDLLEINMEDKAVKINGIVVDFDGFFFDLETAANSLTLTITGTSHSITLSTKHFLTYL